MISKTIYDLYMDYSIHQWPILSSFLLILSFIVVPIRTQIEQEQLQLHSVHVLMRHGDRTPTHFYPNDPFQDVEKYWPEGLGELNDHGRLRIRFAGEYYRKIYDKFLQDTNGWPKQCLSSPAHRAQETANLFMESFLNNTKFSVEVHQDGKMLSTGVKCPLHDHVWLQQMNSKKVKEYLDSKRNYIDYLSEKTGQNYWLNESNTLRNMEFLTTTLEIERDEYHLSVPEWALNQTIIKQLDDMKRHAFWFDWQPIEIQKLRIGLLLNNITEHIRTMATNDNNDLDKNDQRFFLYSAHDVNQVILLQALELYDQIDRKPPSYSSAIVFEHYQTLSSMTKDTKHFIRIIYRQIFNKFIPPKELSKFYVSDRILTMNSCHDEFKNEKLCSFEEFDKITRPLRILNEQEWNAECFEMNHITDQIIANQWIIILTLIFTIMMTRYYFVIG
ncbi:prostatic acid phosphatase-like [Dermatophagoides pteronyssinus]|uniref:acid phosphatase n=1 Tax=Dermatophagoides pteronyssinus TaxID=6956 RepID=A0A6P6XY08_DERPT|nr:prostatic acid phosphatase-like [Dermatophagoides pteronyssinus]